MSELDGLAAYFRDLEARDRFSGVVLVTRGRSTLYSGAYGYASRAWKVKATLAVRFDTASVTKLFTAVAVLQLIDRKQLAFETSAVEVLGLRDTAISAEVTVFHLLTHTSGIGDDADEEAGESYEALWRAKPNYSVNETADLLPQFVHRPPNFPPGQACRYCNCGYVLLGLLIERASGMPYRDYVRKHVFARAGMAHSDFFRLDRAVEDVAEGADPVWGEAGDLVGWRRNIYSFPPIGSPDGGAHVTAGDLDRFVRAVRAGALLSPELTAAFFSPQVNYRTLEGGAIRYGYGLWFFVNDADQVVFCEKEGINPGVSAAVRHYPEQDITVVMLSNMEHGVWEPLNAIHDVVMAGGPRG